MSTWNERVEVERNELNEKLQKLTGFINNREKFTELPKKQQMLLERQERAMKAYLDILDQRLRVATDQ